MNCILCKKNLENKNDKIKFKKIHICRECFSILSEKTKNITELLWEAILSNVKVSTGSYLRVGVYPVLISQEKIILGFSNENYSKIFHSKKNDFIDTLKMLYANYNITPEVELIVDSKYKVANDSIQVNREYTKEEIINDIIERYIDKNIYDVFWGNTVILNIFRRRDFIFAEGYYSALKILLAIAKDNIPNIEQYLNDVDERKDTLINPIMLIYHFYIELSLKRYVEKLCSKSKKIHDKIKLVNYLEKLWLDKTSQLTEDFWEKEGFPEGYFIGDKFKNIYLIINKVHEIDPDSLKFRYSSTPLKDSEVFLDLDKIEEEVDILYDFFEDLNIAISKL